MFPCVEIAEIKFLAISSKLKGILVEHISEICRVNSQLKYSSLCSVRIRTKTWVIRTFPSRIYIALQTFLNYVNYVNYQNYVKITLGNCNRAASSSSYSADILEKNKNLKKFWKTAALLFVIARKTISGE